jgi:hypothetical protein
VNLVRPDQSMLVLKVGSGHNCWVADPSACAATMLVWIRAWIGAGSASTTSVQLIAPPVQAAGGGKQFPADPTAGNPSFQSTVYPLLTRFCVGCHTSSSATAQQPYFASSNINEAYAAAQPKINLASPNQSRFYVRLADEFHHCWVTPSSGGAPDCPGELGGDAGRDHRVRHRHPGDADRSQPGGLQRAHAQAGHHRRRRQPL